MTTFGVEGTGVLDPHDVIIHAPATGPKLCSATGQPDKPGPVVIWSARRPRQDARE